MALVKRNTAASAPASTEESKPKFEAMDADEGGEAGDTTQVLSPAARLAAAAAQREAEQPAEEPAPVETSKVTSIAKAGSSAVAVSKAMTNPLAGLKDAFRVEFNTLRNLQITNGNVVDKDTGKALGDVITLELLSFQDQWTVSPGVDGDEGKEHVRYSDDGVTTSKGESCADHLKDLKEAGFDKAKIEKRMVICGAVVDPGKVAALKDCLVQINLAPSSKGPFDRYMMDQAFAVGKGRVPADGAQLIRIECALKTEGKKTWTIASFTRA